MFSKLRTARITPKMGEDIQPGKPTATAFLYNAVIANLPQNNQSRVKADPSVVVGSQEYVYTCNFNCIDEIGSLCIGALDTNPVVLSTLENIVGDISRKITRGHASSILLFIDASQSSNDKDTTILRFCIRNQEVEPNKETEEKKVGGVVSMNHGNFPWRNYQVALEEVGRRVEIENRVQLVASQMQALFQRLAFGEERPVWLLDGKIDFDRLLEPTATVEELAGRVRLCNKKSRPDSLWPDPRIELWVQTPAEVFDVQTESFGFAKSFTEPILRLLLKASSEQEPFDELARGLLEFAQSVTKQREQWNFNIRAGYLPVFFASVEFIFPHTTGDCTLEMACKFYRCGTRSVEHSVQLLEQAKAASSSSMY
jgi:hypothetical protein